MLKFTIPALAALGLLAFGAQSEATDADSQPGAAPMGWHLSREGAMAKLAYGADHSDQLALMMTCEPGEAETVIYGDVKPVSPGVQKASMASAAIDPWSGGLENDMRLSVDAPSLKQLAQRGNIRVEGDSGEFELTARPEERKLISDFFAYCGTRPA